MDDLIQDVNGGVAIADPAAAPSVAPTQAEVVKPAVDAQGVPVVPATHEESVPYERFREVNEQKKRLTEDLATAEARLSQQSQPPKKEELTLDKLYEARQYWLDQGDFGQAMRVVDMINERKMDEKMRIVVADIDDKYRAENDNPELKDRSSELYKETTRVFNEMGNLTRSQAAEIAYARLAKAGKVGRPAQRTQFEQKGQLGSGITQVSQNDPGVTDDEISFCAKAGISVDRYKQEKIATSRRQ